jgi:mannitol-1-phosphate/altronate dehydrogenase
VESKLIDWVDRRVGACSTVIDRIDFETNIADIGKTINCGIVNPL